MNMHDWRLAGDPDPDIDSRPWSVEVEDASEVSFRIEAICPEGTRRYVWMEIQDGNLVIHAYDPIHEEPVNLRIGRTGIIVDSDRDEAFLTHFNVGRFDAMERFVRKMAGMSLPEEEAAGDVDEYIADLDEERLYGEYSTFMDMVRSAREIVK